MCGYTAGMSGPINIEGKEYISSKRASELSGYAQDYIGQLARTSQVDAQRLGGLWYVSMESLEKYKSTAEAYKPEPPVRTFAADPDSLVSFEGKEHVSASKASQITGYHQDYVGQLARAGTIPSRQVGNRWYVERAALLAHKEEKDRLLGAVQSESVGLVRVTAEDATRASEKPPETDFEPVEAFLTYTKEEGDLFPTLAPSGLLPGLESESIVEGEEVSIPIRVVESGKKLHHTEPVKHVKHGGAVHGKTIFYGTLAATAFTIVIVLSFGFSSLKGGSVYAGISKSGFTASASTAFGKIGDFLERLLVHELVFKRF